MPQRHAPLHGGGPGGLLPCLAPPDVWCSAIYPRRGGCGPICLRSLVGRRPGEPDTLQYLASIVKNYNKPLTLCLVPAVAGRRDLPHDQFQRFQRAKGFAPPGHAAIYRASDRSCLLLGVPLL